MNWNHEYLLSWTYIASATELTCKSNDITLTNQMLPHGTTDSMINKY